jgi:small subunit ribosomal protein S1
MKMEQLPDSLDTESGEEDDFETLLNQNFTKLERFDPGEKVSAKVVKVADEWAFIDFGGKSEGYIPVSELTNEEGEFSVKEGDFVEAYFLSARDSEYLFTTRIGRGAAGHSHIQAAYDNGIPIEGRIQSETKGGYRIQIAGNIGAFCPYSLMGAGMDLQTAVEAGSSFAFKIIEMDEGGRNIVLSRKAVLEEERQNEITAFRETIEEGMRVHGTVCSIREFGAFIRVGPIEGLIPVSEIGRGRTERVDEALSVGQEVEVKVMRLDWDAGRFSFSIKETIPDPWEDIQQKYPVGSVHIGKVERLAGFGAFVNLEPGVDGLLHISRLGRGKRINHPREVISEGMEIEVRIEKVEPDQKRLGLAWATAEREALEIDRRSREEISQYSERSAADAKGALGTLGDIFSNSLNRPKNRR